MFIRLILLLLISLSVKAQQPCICIVLDKQNKHFLDSLHPIFQPYMDSVHIDYQPILLRDSAHWILGTQMLSDPLWRPVLGTIYTAGYSDSIQVQYVDTSRMIITKMR